MRIPQTEAYQCCRESDLGGDFSAMVRFRVGNTGLAVIFSEIADFVAVADRLTGTSLFGLGPCLGGLPLLW